MESQNGKFTYTEILSQGEAWEKTLTHWNEQKGLVLDWCKKPHDEMIYIGCGSTYYLSLAASKIWTLLTNGAARGIPSSELWYYPSSTFSKQKPLLIAISRSGETTETINAIESYKNIYQEDWLVISCYPESRMAKTAPLKLLAPDAIENSIAQTRSFSSMYVLTQLLAGYAANNQPFINEIYRLPSLFSPIILKYEQLIISLANNPKFQHFVFLGSGINYGLASETMLKMKEMSTSISEVFNFMEFRHGPMSMITDRSLVIGLLTDSRKKEELQVMQEMKLLGASTLALVEDASGVDADYIIELKSDISEQARGALFLPILQLLGYHRAIHKHLNPDQPTNLNSVVYL
jgi:glutamine---fructose-6-phosphate transaminase (isomerizing)